MLILASASPLSNALKGLQNIAKDRGVGRGERVRLEDDEPTKVIGDLLGDINKSSRAAEPEIIPTVQAVSTSKLAAISTIVEVV